MTFSVNGMKAAKALTNLWESGSFKGKVEHLAVLDERSGVANDGAGISYGKSQTTENSGGLWSLLFEAYAPIGGAFAPSFEPYKEKLFKKGGDANKKFALTEDQDFKDLLVRAAKEDPLMSVAQDTFFDQRFFQPALKICEEYELSLPLSLAFVYDFCIQSGPGSKFGDGSALDRLNTWQEELEEELDEMDLVTYFCKKRHEFLGNLKQASWSRYRTASMLTLMNEKKEHNWNLQTPLTILFLRKKYTGASDKTVILKEEDLAYQSVPTTEPSVG